MHPNRSRRRVHSAEFKAKILAECRQPDSSVSAVAIGHGLNPNVVRKWLAGQGLKRMGAAAHVALTGIGIPVPVATARALQFVPVKLARPEPACELASEFASESTFSAPAARPDIRIELECGGLQVKLQCPANTSAHYAAQLRALANALRAARGS